MHNSAKITPMLQQYLQIKEEHKDSILFYRMGDFYEMFFEDAIEASKILDITLTSRNRDDELPIPMAGVPFHSAEPYIQKLLAVGRRVAICEQVEDPKLAKGVVKREVVRVVTPGTNILEDSKAGRTFLAAVYGRGPSASPRDDVSSPRDDVSSPRDDVKGLAYIDLSTGLFRVTVQSREKIEQELDRIMPAELLVLKGDSGIKNAVNIELNLDRFSADTAKKYLRDPLPDKTWSIGLQAAGALVSYLLETQKDTPINHINGIEFYTSENSLMLDSTTIRNLEIFKTQYDNLEYGSLFNTIDKTVSRIGSRLLHDYLLYPSKDIDEIKRRLNLVERFFNNDNLRDSLRGILGAVRDIERLIGRVTMGLCNARDLLSLGSSISCLPILREKLEGDSVLKEFTDRWNDLDKVSGLINNAIHPEPPLTIREGGIIREGYNSELDELISLSREGKGFLNALESRERARTGIPLKVKFNNVFGYYIEITNSHLSKVPSDYIRKQTLVNAERFITPELKEYEERVLNAEERRKSLEYDLFQGIRENVSGEGNEIQRMAKIIARLDVVLALAETARRNKYCRPVVNNEDIISIKQGRHPVIETMGLKEKFIANDIYLDDKDSRMLIITGPNMAGKSTVMRQVALIVLLAQIGSFVPAEGATIGIVDQIFTRVGASDRLSQGESTFMVEMVETANILRRATSKSLIILDEIGRGTSTYDGISIAWSVAEMIDEEIGAKTLFATHYHELTELALKRDKIKNFHVAVKEWRGEIIFLRQLVPGPSSRSYGIDVGRLAGLPDKIIRRAREILKELEASKGSAEEVINPDKQLTLFNTAHPVLESIGNLDLSKMTPIEALNRLHELQDKI